MIDISKDGKRHIVKLGELTFKELDFEHELDIEMAYQQRFNMDDFLELQKQGTALFLMQERIARRMDDDYHEALKANLIELEADIEKLLMSHKPYAKVSKELDAQLKLSTDKQDVTKIIKLRKELKKLYLPAYRASDKKKMQVVKESIKATKEELKSYDEAEAENLAEQASLVPKINLVSDAVNFERIAFLWFLEKVYDRPLAQNNNDATEQIQEWIDNRGTDKNSKKFLTWMRNITGENENDPELRKEKRNKAIELGRLLSDTKKFTPTWSDASQSNKAVAQASTKKRTASTTDSQQKEQ